MPDDAGDVEVASSAPTPWTDSFVDLYRTEHAPMVRLAFLLTGGDPEAEDWCTMRSSRCIGRWDSIDTPGGYLRTVVVNACRSHQRRQARRLRLPLRAAAAANDAPDELTDAIRQLPERQRAAVVLRYYADLPEAEIAALLGAASPRSSRSCTARSARFVR